MPGQSKTKEKVSDQSSKSNDSNMDIDSDITEEESINLIKKICQNLKHCEWDQLSVKMKESICQLQFCLGQIIEKNLYNDGLAISKEYRDIAKLKSAEPKLWLKNRNELVLSFLEGATNINLNHENEKKINALTHTVEQIYYSRNLNTITPFAFKRNLVTYTLTHSKQAVQIYSNWEGSGGYTTLLNILLEPAPPLRCSINTDIINTVDNNQKVGKCRRRIKEGSKIPISICTTVGHIETKPATDLQYNPQLSPENWLNKLSPNNNLEKVNTLESNSLNIFRLYRGKYITSIIDEIKQEQIVDEFSYGIT